MLVNKNIKILFKEIAEQTSIYMNKPDKERKYIRRLLNIYKNQLSEEEQLYILNSILENIHYKNIVTDPDNVLTLHTIKMKNITYTFFLVTLAMFIAAGLFKTNDTLNNILNTVANAFKLFSI